MGSEYDVIPSRLQGPLFNGSLGRALRCSLALVVCTWFAYENPLNQAYVYLLPVILVLSIALYPPFIATICMYWMILVPYCIVRVVYVTMISAISAHCMEKRKWTEDQVRWIPFAWYLALALLYCPSRAALNNKMVYSIVFAAHYVFDNALFPIYALGSQGLSFIADGRMIAILRAIAVDIDHIPWIPKQIKLLLSPLFHKQCNHLFGKTAPKNVIWTDLNSIGNERATKGLFDWSMVPNQSCSIPVPLYVRLLGGAFEGSKESYMHVSTDASAKFVSFKYLPNAKFFLRSMWYAEGDYGAFRGLFYCTTICGIIFTIIVLSKPNSRARYCLKERLIHIQRYLYKCGTNIVESAALISGADRITSRMCLVSIPSLKLGNNRISRWFRRRYVPSTDADHLHCRAQDLMPLVNTAYLEAGVSQTPGIESASALRGLVHVLSHEAVNLSLFARALASVHPEHPAISWHHPIGGQIRMNQVQLAKVQTSDEYAARWLRALYFGNWRVNCLVERALQVDEVCGRDQSTQEILCEIRHALQMELRESAHLLKHCPLSKVVESFRDTPLAADRFVRTYGYITIEKCKAAILYCEGEIEKSWSTFLKSILVSIYGPSALIVKEMVASWRNFFSSMKLHRANDMIDPQFVLDELMLGRPVSGESSGIRIWTATYVSRERVIPLHLNAEVWSSIRFFIGQAIIFCVFFFNQQLANKAWLDSARIHREDAKLLGDELSLDGVDTSLIYKIFKPSTKGEGQEGKIKVLPDLLWAHVPMLTVSKLVPWTFLGYYCSNLITFQGTIKRTFLRYIAMLIGTGVAWLALYLGFRWFSDKESNPYDDSLYAFKDGSLLRIKMTTWLCGLGCLLIFIGTIVFANPFQRRFTFDPQWGYMGQILTYHFLVVTYGLIFDVRQCTDELVLVRVLGHSVGSLLSIVLALCLFPTSANTQQRLRLSNLTVPLRKSFVAFNCAFCQGVFTSVSAEAWKDYLAAQLNIADFELSHYKKIVEDASIADTVRVFRNDAILLEIGNLMQQAIFLRTSAIRLMENSEIYKEADVWKKDMTFYEWVNRTSPLQDDDKLLKSRKRQRPRPLKLVEPVSPYKWYDYESGDSTDSVWPISRPEGYLATSPAPETQETMVNLKSESMLSSNISVDSSEFAEDESLSQMSLLSHMNVLQEQWLCIEYALLTVKSSKFDMAIWSDHTSTIKSKLAEMIEEHQRMRSDDPFARRCNLLYSIWADELTILSRIVSYIEEYYLKVHR